MRELPPVGFLLGDKAPVTGAEKRLADAFARARSEAALPSALGPALDALDAPVFDVCGADRADTDS